MLLLSTATLTASGTSMGVSFAGTQAIASRIDETLTIAIEVPASIAAGPEASGSVGSVTGDARQIVATSSTSGIPAAALAAYQRAESVINSADEGCNLTWQLIAAIGRVESNHGRFGGNFLDDDGIAQPGIYGIALDGTNNSSVIRDTDAAQLDNDPVYDRAVGPMQFIPSTWSVVGVDADGDGQRNPQDIDDAALATAVYLCSGTQSTAGDLSTTAGQRSAVYRYNHSQAYVDLVISIMEAYLDGDFTSIPNNTSAAGLLIPQPHQGGSGERVVTQEDAKLHGEVAGTVPATLPTDETERPPEPGRPPDSGDGGDTGKDTDPAGSVPPTVPGVVEAVVEPVETVLTLAQAILQCARGGHLNNLLKNDDPFDICVRGYTTRS